MSQIRYFLLKQNTRKIGETHTEHKSTDAGYALLRTAFKELFFGIERYNGNSAQTVIEREQRTQRGSNSSNGGGGGLIALGRNHRENDGRTAREPSSLPRPVLRKSFIRERARRGGDPR